MVGENRPRLYASMLAAQALGAIPVPLYQDAAAAEFVFPISNAEVALRDRRGPGAGRQAARGARRSARSSARIWFDDPRGLRHYDEPGLAPLDALVDAGRAYDAAHPGFFDAEVAQAPARRRRGDVLHLGHDRQAEGRGAHRTAR